MNKFGIPAKGVGLQDYTARMERTTVPTLSPTLRQRAALLQFEGFLPPRAWPLFYRTIMELPQEDGSMDWTASSIILHYTDCEVAVEGNWLVRAGLMEYASLDDFYINNPSNIYPDTYGYGYARVRYSKGIVTKQGSCYGLCVGVWSNNLWEYVHITSKALMTNLSPYYMRWGHT